MASSRGSRSWKNMNFKRHFLPSSIGVSVSNEVWEYKSWLSDKLLFHEHWKRDKLRRATCDFRPNVTLHSFLPSELFFVLFVHDLVSSCQVQRVLGQLIASHVCLTAPGTLYCLLCPTLVLLLSQEGEKKTSADREKITGKRVNTLYAE